MTLQVPGFASESLLHYLEEADPAALDVLDFGLIGFDSGDIVRRYNATESRLSGLAVATVMNQPLFDRIAPCMNNYMVAQRFEDASIEGRVLDESLDYVLTVRVKPVRARLRLLAAPSLSLRYVAILRKS